MARITKRVAALRAKIDRSKLYPVAEALALVMLLPLKTVEPYTLLVDRQTGYVEALKPIERQTIAPDAALTRSFLVQYVIARESFDRPSLKANYRKTALWSAPEARAAYVAAMQATKIGRAHV